MTTKTTQSHGTSRDQDQKKSASTSASSHKSANSSSSHNTSSNEDNRSHGNQGFASMPKEQVREIAAMGGRASHGSHNTDNNNKK